MSNAATLIPTFADEFDSLSLWNGEAGSWMTRFTYGGLASYTLPTNGEDQLYVDPWFRGLPDTLAPGPLGLNPFAIENGKLVITGAPLPDGLAPFTGGYGWSSGVITTQTSFAQTYGHFEIKVDLDHVKGSWPAFWMLPADGTATSELDIFEYLGINTDLMSSALHAEGLGSKLTWHEVEGLTSGSHVIGATWTPYGVEIFIDGQRVTSYATPDQMSKPMYLLANLAMGGDWGGPPDPGASATLGIDWIRVWQLPEYTLEGYRLKTSGAAERIVEGTARYDRLDGSSRNDRLGGAGGADRMQGGLGDDTYVVTKGGARVIEALGEGIDTVRSTVSFRLPENVENLTLTGRADTAATGHVGANLIVGNSGNNLITGGLGNDVLVGGSGRDTFQISRGDGSDILRDFDSGPGLGDVVRLNGTAFTSFAEIREAMTQHGRDVHLALDHLDTLVFRDHQIADFRADDFQLPATPPVGAEPIRFVTGTADVETVYGTPLDERMFDGHSGDTLVGGHGDDLYFVSPGTRVVEAPRGGIDTVETWLWSYALPDNVENLWLRADGAEGIGNARANRLVGFEGSQTLIGGGGNDLLKGGEGRDRFVFDDSLDPRANLDRIVDFNPAEDTIVLSQNAFDGLAQAGQLHRSAFDIGRAADTRGERILYDARSGKLLFDADGSGHEAPVAFAVIGRHLHLTEHDLVIV